MNVESIQFDNQGLVPAIVQDARSKAVLTLAYMNEESLKRDIGHRRNGLLQPLEARVVAQGRNIREYSEGEGHPV